MKIGFLLPTLFASKTLYPDRIFAPRTLARDMIDGLTSRGHEVMVFTTPDFESSGRLESVPIDVVLRRAEYHKLRNLSESEKAIRTDEAYKRTYEIAVCALAYKTAGERGIDVMHAYHDFLFTPHYFEETSGVPTVYTIHDPLPPDKTFEHEQYMRFSRHAYVSISDAQRRPMPEMNFIGTAYHGINIPEYSYSSQQGEHLYFVGRLVPEKGLHTAMTVAEGHRLVVATNVPKNGERNEYYDTQIAHRIGTGGVQMVGAISREKNLEYMRGAKALLFPIEWEEPFGMVMIEAMACGTPVIAYNRGSVAEVIQDNVTGFIVDPDDADRPGRGTWTVKKTGAAGLIEAIQRIGGISREACRRYVESRFTRERMVQDYERVYTQLSARKLS